jgi:uncharacterized protein (TIGR02996 family)
MSRNLLRDLEAEIYSRPDDFPLRLAFADALEEYGDREDSLRAEFIRLQFEQEEDPLKHNCFRLPHCRSCWRQERCFEILRGRADGTPRTRADNWSGIHLWAGDLCYELSVIHRRGFGEIISIDSRNWVRWHITLTKHLPVLEVHYRGSFDPFIDQTPYGYSLAGTSAVAVPPGEDYTQRLLKHHWPKITFIPHVFASGDPRPRDHDERSRLMDHPDRGAFDGDFLDRLIRNATAQAALNTDSFTEFSIISLPANPESVAAAEPQGLIRPGEPKGESPLRKAYRAVELKRAADEARQVMARGAAKVTRGLKLNPGE